MTRMGQVEDEITPFLKARRAALDPVALGLPNGVTRRRVRGLRREEVAQLAGISVDYYTRIEQGRASAISDGILDAVARALRLTPDEHIFLRNITAPGRRQSGGACAAAERPHVRPQIQELLDAMGDTVPALVYGPGTDLLAWNRLAALVYAMDLDAMPEHERNGTRLVFMHPLSRELYPDWRAVAEDTVSTLRADVGRFPENGRPYQVMCELRDTSEEFRDMWEAQDVRDRDHGVKRIVHPEVGELVLTFEAFTLPKDPHQRVCTFTAPKGSETERKLRELATRITASV
jgi:transcriptional regulator with XRE-family HTH domain